MPIIDEDKLYPHQREFLRSIEKEASFPSRYGGKTMRLADNVIVGDAGDVRLIDYKTLKSRGSLGKVVFLPDCDLTTTCTSTTEEPQNFDEKAFIDIVEKMLAEEREASKPETAGAYEFRAYDLTPDSSYGIATEGDVRNRIANGAERMMNSGAFGFGEKALRASTYADMYTQNPTANAAFDLMVWDEVHTMKNELERRQKKLEDCDCPFCKAGYPVRNLNQRIIP